MNEFLQYNNFVNEYITGLSDEKNNAQEEEISSLAGSTKAEPKEPAVSAEQITQLGATYKVKERVTTRQEQPQKSFPSGILAMVVIVPLMVLFLLGAVGNKNEKSKGSFLFDTLESKYFTMSVNPDYEINSVVDKKIPFLEKHDLINNSDGEKYMSIVIKDVKFNYTLDDNSLIKGKRELSKLYDEMPYELNSKQGLYFKKIDENFEHTVFLVDRNNSLLYEITYSSVTSLANNVTLQKEFRDMLNTLTFL